MTNKKSNYATEAGKLKAPSDKQNKTFIRKIKKCSYSGCPINATTDVNGHGCCSFHWDTDFHKEVTQAIIHNIGKIKAYGKMVKWSASDWQNQQGWIFENEFCHMRENEYPSIYLHRFYQWMILRVNEDATKLAKGEALI